MKVQFDKEIAKVFGVKEAILIQYLYDLPKWLPLDHIKKYPDDPDHDWLKLSAPDVEDNLQVFTYYQAQLIFRRLVDMKVVRRRRCKGTRSETGYCYRFEDEFLKLFGDNLDA